ncbi:YciI family protein [Paenisporosarcina sp. NPDC076898]|uniref:YciI family protein n=1 Tax=unclassified Paenisporosarcina TaxID=2642018 RepID=UPI003CFCC1C7
MEKLQFLYQLKLIPSLLEETNWTDYENNIVQKHFEELQRLQKIGTLILAGRTLDMDSSGFGIVILEVNSEEEARTLMENDPAVKEGIMTATLFPYRVALIRD